MSLTSFRPCSPTCRAAAYFSLLFFSLLSIAALTSTISILEMLVSTLLDESNLSRHKVVIGTSAMIFILGIPSALSFGKWSHLQLFGRSIFDVMDYLSANILLPLGGLLVAVFVGWYMQKREVHDELLRGFGDTYGKRRVTAVWLRSWKIRRAGTDLPGNLKRNWGIEIRRLLFCYFAVPFCSQRRRRTRPGATPEGPVYRFPA
ncbi:MAG: hypothetical protein U5N26_07375 [Candidatus Marinimicrobia bacterium]|nr:hypothetical protein [Candidatus Neomarinimicrobiota bacterium]